MLSVLHAFDADQKMTPVPETHSSDGTQRRLRILVVDDDEMVRELAADMLEAMESDVVQAESGQEALEVVENAEHAFDVALLDVVMPEMNGKELADELAKRFHMNNVVFMSGFTHNVIADAGVNRKKAIYVQKPFSASDLREAVRTALAEG